MSAAQPPVLEQIAAKLRETNQEEAQRNYASTIFTLTKSLEEAPPTADEFTKFIIEMHDVMIKGDSSKRCSILRAIRYCLVNKDAVKIILDNEVHYVVVSSLEKEGDSAVERMQALKIMERVQEIAPEMYPVAFARSLVAVANSKEDSFRKICIETLRELALKNPEMVVAVDGFVPMMDAVVEPITQPLADSIVLTVIYLLNDPATRVVVAHGVDLRLLLAPLTDLDSSASDLSGKWKACKSALVLLMRSWVGLIQLAADDMAWPTLVRMLRDPKVPLATQEIILDTISDIFEPVSSKVKQIRTGRGNRHSAGLCEEQDPAGQPFGAGPGQPLSPGGKQLPPAEGRSRPTSERIQGSPSMVEGGTGTGSGPGIGYRNSGLSDPPPPTGRFQINPPPAYETPTKIPEAKATTHRSSFAWGGGAASSNSATAQAGQNLLSPQTRRTFSVANFFTHRDNKAKGVPPAAPAPTAGTAGAPQRRGSYTNATASSMASLQGAGPGKAQDDSAVSLSGEMSTLMKIFHLRKRRGSKGEGGDGRNHRAESPSVRSAGSLSNSDLRLAGIFNEHEALMDPIFNLMDNYKALLCCAFLHANLIESLYFLGVNGATQIALKSRRLMVNFLRTLAFLFPEDMCSELLTIPSLIEFAASVSSTRTAKRAHKSSQMLITLAEAFTLMPFKQVSGNHISGLSLSAKLQRNSVAGGITTAGPAGKTGLVPTNPPPAVAARANLPPLNIQTIFELAEEIKISSFSTIASGDSTVDGSSSIVAGVNGGGTATDMLNALRNSLTPEIDKNDFVKQLDLSRVIGNVGKEPFKWDWMTISDMLEYSFSNSSRLSEALKTKWVRRVSGFYRCSVEEKGYFANLDWEPIHLQYLECACNLYRVLLKDEAGMAFLTQDRRGMLFNEIAHEIENLTVAAGSTNVTAQSVALQRNVFRLYSCQCSMAREFFTLLGRILHNTGSKHLMQGTSIFVNLQKLGQFRSLDYASRLVLTSLSFTDGGVMSKALLQQWTQKSGCTTELRTYAHTLLRILLRSGAGVEAFAWRIDAIAAQLEGARALHTPSLYQALQEAVHDKSNLRAIIARRPKLLDNPSVQRILIRFLSIAEGIEYLSFDKNGERTYKEGSDEPTSWLSDELEAWKTTKCQQYVAEVDQALTMAFAQCDNKVETISADPVVQGASGLEPIPLQTMEFLSELSQRGGGGGSGGPVRGDEPSSATHSTVRLGNGDGQGSSENSWYTRDPNSSLLVDLHGLVRVPWNIEVRVSSSSNNPASGSGYNKDMSFAPISSNAPITSTTVVQQSPLGEYLRVDSFLDAAHLPSPLCYDVTSDQSNLIKVRGVILDNRGFPTGHPIPYNKVVSATLLAGVCPITRAGRALSPGEMKVQRRKTTVSEGAYEAVSRMSATSLAESPLPNGANSYDLPVSYHLDAPYDWTTCKSAHRQNNSNELPDGLFSVTVPGEPVVLIFSRRSPSNTTSGNSTSMRLGRGTTIGVNQLPSVPENAGRPPSGTTPKAAGGKVSNGGVVWLVEVQYYFRLETGQAIFVPMPSHIYGELTRTIEGCEVLAKRKVVSDLLTRARQLYNVCAVAPVVGRGAVLSPSASPPLTPAPQTPLTPVVDAQTSRAEVLAAYNELQAALWSLGHIGSNELGCALILEADRRFITWCIEGVYSCTYYSLRATFFYVLGLLSRTQQGRRRLLKHGWDSAPRDGNSAVAFPLRASNLFRHSGVIAGTSPPSPRNQSSPQNRFPFSPLGPTPTSPISRNGSDKGGAFTAPTHATTLTSAATAPATITNNFSGLSIYTTGPLPPPPRNAALSPSHMGVMSPPRLNTLPDTLLSHLSVYNRTSLAPSKNLEIDVLHLIAKLPGVIVYKDCKARLDHLRKEHPELFDQRGLYLQVHRMLESYTFKLNARREILALFSDEARVKTPTE